MTSFASLSYHFPLNLNYFWYLTIYFQINCISKHVFILYNPHACLIHISSSSTFIKPHPFIMSSPRTTYSNNAKKQKLVIIPPKQLFIDLTNEDNTTPSPPPQCSSPSAPNAPSKTPSTNGTSTSSIPSTSSINDYINTHLSPPPRASPSQPTIENTTLALTLSLSQLTPLDAHFSSPLSIHQPITPSQGAYLKLMVTLAFVAFTTKQLCSD